jgi:hypothetical protein
MKKTTLFLLLFCLGFAYQATAQHKTIVYGDLGVGNVNISIVNTKHGTSTDVNGHYELPIYDRTKTVNLYYSCIGYQDTVVSLTTRQLQRDSINISFKMRPFNYALQEVTVTENASQLAYENKTVWVMDYKVQDDGIYMVAGNSNESVLLHLSFEQDTISLKPIASKYQELYRDAFDNLHLIGSDSTYQIFCDGKQLHLLYGSKKDIFRQKMKPIVAATDSIIVLEMWRSYGQEVVFVAVNINNGQRFLLQSIGGETTEMANFWALDDKRKSKMDKLAEEDTEFIDIEKETNIEIRNLKEVVKKRVMLHPVYCPLYGIGNKLYLFAFPENALIVFDQNGKEENKMEMDFHKQLGIGLSKHLTFNNPWNKNLVFDRARMMMYAQYKTNGLITLKEIDLRDGKTKREIQLRDHVFPQNIQVYNGEVYYLFLDNQQKRERDKRSLYKTKLD